MRLTGKQKAFAEEYVQDFNGTRAARAAGYKGDANTLSSLAWENLRKDNIKKYIRQLLTDRTMSAEEVLEKLRLVAVTDVSPYMNDDGEISVSSLREAGLGYLIKGSRNTRQGVIIELMDKQKALVDIGRHHGLFTDKTEIMGAGGGPVETEDKTTARAISTLSHALSDLLHRRDVDGEESEDPVDPSE